MSFIQHIVLKKQTTLNAEKISQSYKLYIDYFHNSSIHENIRNSKEEQFQEVFLRELLVKILGYTLNHVPNYNLITELKNETNAQKADLMLSLNAELQTKRQRFISRLKNNFEDIKLTGALEKFDESDFKGFVAELKKQKITLSLKQQDEWEEYFNEYKSECNTISSQIAETDNTIDKMVYKLYGLTEEEIKVVENK